ncbi:DUF305 domain-containing protein [Thermostaphylospora chromogena]|uniref:Uncharacterized conserved protein, DUF305 family n=1 Tax=Thermostaphylospora chromogena TaxID=35622 RepID=A0A1H1HQU6_9ACTN|nr:DUF305 domain-containing protein [Thermostaphylospora chromogena]SDR27739.1 Uncharacterized conserved protein, DUF305 family [Thermostaphylospora chromogena]
MKTRSLALLLGAAGIVALTGCSGTPPTEAAQPAAAAARPADGGQEHNDADVRFSVEMIPHHRQTIELAELVEGRTADPYITGLAAEISAKESKEIEQMAAWLTEWNVPSPPADAHEGHDMPGMLTAGEIAMVERASGEEFERLWLRTLSKHLKSGVQMAERVLSSGRHAPTALLAGQMITAQRAEIAEIDARLAR